MATWGCSSESPASAGWAWLQRWSAPRTSSLPPTGLYPPFLSFSSTSASLAPGGLAESQQSLASLQRDQIVLPGVEDDGFRGNRPVREGADPGRKPADAHGRRNQHQGGTGGQLDRQGTPHGGSDNHVGPERVDGLLGDALAVLQHRSQPEQSLGFLKEPLRNPVGERQGQWRV